MPDLVFHQRSKGIQPDQIIAMNVGVPGDVVGMDMVQHDMLLDPARR
jgi:hypothetical protein